MNDSENSRLPEHLQANKRTLIAALTVAGTATVAQIEYEGSGDSGSVQDVCITLGNGLPFDDQVTIDVLDRESCFTDGSWQHHTTVKSTTLRQALEDFAEEVLEELHDGWENNDGASGEVIFVLGKDGTEEVRVEHNDYFTESDYTETQL